MSSLSISLILAEALRVECNWDSDRRLEMMVLHVIRACFLLIIAMTLLVSGIACSSNTKKIRIDYKMQASETLLNDLCGSRCLDQGWTWWHIRKEQFIMINHLYIELKAVFFGWSVRQSKVGAVAFEETFCPLPFLCDLWQSTARRHHIYGLFQVHQLDESYTSMTLLERKGWLLTKLQIFSWVVV